MKDGSDPDNNLRVRLRSLGTQSEMVELVHGLGGILLERSIDGHTCRFAGIPATATLGYAPDEWRQDESFWTRVVVHPDDREAIAESVRSAGQNGSRYAIEYRGIHADGGIVWLRECGRIYETAESKEAALGLVTDITPRTEVEADLADAHRAVQLLKDIAQASNEATELSTVLDYSIERICKHGGWDLGHCWLFNASKGHLTSTDVWHADNLTEFEAFQAATARLDVHKSGAMPRRAAEAGHPVWVRRLDLEPDFYRLEPALQAGLRSAVAVPILVGDEVHAVLEFFARGTPPPDPWDLLRHLGVTLGRVAERVRASERTAQEEMRFRRVIQTAHDGFVAMDAQGAIESWSRRSEELFGWSKDEVVGRRLADVLLPERYREAHTEGLSRYLETGEAHVLDRPLELEALHRDGHEVPIELTISQLDIESGVLFCAFLRDISERLASQDQRRQLEIERMARAHAEALEMEVRRSEERYRFLANSIPQQVWSADADGRLRYMNDVGLTYFGVSSVEERSDWYSVVHPKDRAHAVSTWGAALKAGKTYQARVRLRRADGSHRWHLALARPELDEHGSTIGWYGTCTDMEEQMSAEAARDRALERLAVANRDLDEERQRLEQQTRELAATANALERSNAELDQFAYVASHDLRAPLRGISNLSQFLEEDLEDKLTDDTRELLGLLRSRVRRMESLIDGILAYSRATRTPVPEEDVDTGQLVSDLIDMLALPDEVQVFVADEMPVLSTHKNPLQRVLLNLLSNAARYAAESTDPEIVVGAEPQDGAWEFFVRDNGPGIAPDYHERIWGVFQTLAGDVDRGGTGIGLAIVQKIVEHVGGRAWVESEPGEGATFRFLWPTTPPHTP